MNTKIIIGIVLGLVVLGGVGYVVINRSGMVGDTQDTSALAPTGNTNFSALLRRGGSYTCTFTATDPRVASKGVVYINDKSIRGDFQSDASALGAGQVLESHMIRHDGYTYVWTDMFPQGFKVKDSASDKEQDTDAPAQATLALDQGMEVTYDCKPWTSDVSLFAAPANVTFSEGALPVSGAMSQ